MSNSTDTKRKKAEKRKEPENEKKVFSMKGNLKLNSKFKKRRLPKNTMFIIDGFEIEEIAIPLSKEKVEVSKVVNNEMQDNSKVELMKTFEDSDKFISNTPISIRKDRTIELTKINARRPATKLKEKKKHLKRGRDEDNVEFKEDNKIRALDDDNDEIRALEDDNGEAENDNVMEDKTDKAVKEGTNMITDIEVTKEASKIKALTDEDEKNRENDMEQEEIQQTHKAGSSAPKEDKAEQKASATPAVIETIRKEPYSKNDSLNMWMNQLTARLQQPGIGLDEARSIQAEIMSTHEAIEDIAKSKKSQELKKAEIEDIKQQVRVRKRGRLQNKDQRALTEHNNDSAANKLAAGELSGETMDTNMETGANVNIDPIRTIDPEEIMKTKDQSQSHEMELVETDIMQTDSNNNDANGNILLSARNETSHNLIEDSLQVDKIGASANATSLVEQSDSMELVEEVQNLEDETHTLDVEMEDLEQKIEEFIAKEDVEMSDDYRLENLKAMKKEKEELERKIKENKRMLIERKKQLTTRRKEKERIQTEIDAKKAQAAKQEADLEATGGHIERFAEHALRAKELGLIKDDKDPKERAVLLQWLQKAATVQATTLKTAPSIKERMKDFAAEAIMEGLGKTESKDERIEKLRKKLRKLYKDDPESEKKRKRIGEQIKYIQENVQDDDLDLPEGEQAFGTPVFAPADDRSSMNSLQQHEVLKIDPDQQKEYLKEMKPYWSEFKLARMNAGVREAEIMGSNLWQSDRSSIKMTSKLRKDMDEKEESFGNFMFFLLHHKFGAEQRGGMKWRKFLMWSAALGYNQLTTAQINWLITGNVNGDLHELIDFQSALGTDKSVLDEQIELFKGMYVSSGTIKSLDEQTEKVFEPVSRYPSRNISPSAAPVDESTHPDGTSSSAERTEANTRASMTNRVLNIPDPRTSERGGEDIENVRTFKVKNPKFNPLLKPTDPKYEPEFIDAKVPDIGVGSKDIQAQVDAANSDRLLRSMPQNLYAPIHPQACDRYLGSMNYRRLSVGIEEYMKTYSQHGWDATNTGEMYAFNIFVMQTYGSMLYAFVTDQTMQRDNPVFDSSLPDGVALEFMELNELVKELTRYQQKSTDRADRISGSGGGARPIERALNKFFDDREHLEKQKGEEPPNAIVIAGGSAFKPKDPEDPTVDPSKPSGGGDEPSGPKDRNAYVAPKIHSKYVDANTMDYGIRNSSHEKLGLTEAVMSSSTKRKSTSYDNGDFSKRQRMFNSFSRR